MKTLARIGSWVAAAAAMPGGKRATASSPEPRRLLDTLPGRDGRERALFRTVEWDHACAEPTPHTPVTAPRRLRGRGRRVLAVGLTVPVVALIAAVVAVAYFTSSGTGTGGASVGTLGAPTIGTHTASGTDVSLDWSAVTPPSGSLDGYYVLRNGSPASIACGSFAAPIATTSCTDTAPTSGAPVTYSYTVVAKWRSWTSTSGSVSVLVKGSQTITFTSTAPASAKVGGSTYSVSATGGASGNAVTFAIDASATSVCSIVGSTVSFVGTGTCVIDANQAGNASYSAATQVQQSFAVAKGDQTISFTSTAPAAAKVGGVTYTPTATATSGLAVAFTIDATSSTVCSISAGVVSFQTVGTCVVDANQAGNTNWNVATQMQQSFAVAKGDQTITFGAITTKTFDQGPLTVSATASSGLTVAFTSATGAVCTVSGTTVTFVTTGTCTINANQAGNTNWNAATQVQQSFTISKGSQTISFTSTNPSPVTVGGPTYTPTATATSGLTVTITLDATSTGCSLSAGVVSFTAAGTCVIDANQAGNTNWNAATQVRQSIIVNVAALTITTWTATSGNIRGTFSGTGGTSGSTVTVTVCMTNNFPSCAAQATVTATVAAGGTWTTGLTGNISQGNPFFARAVQGSPSKTSAVFSFTA